MSKISNLQDLVNQRKEWHQIYLDTKSEEKEVSDILVLFDEMILSHDNFIGLSGEPELFDMIDDNGFNDEYLQTARASYASVPQYQDERNLDERSWAEQFTEETLYINGDLCQRTEFIVSCMEREADPNTIFYDEYVESVGIIKVSDNFNRSWDKQDDFSLKPEDTNEMVNFS